jgi:diacylglycerol kinase (ATP)
MKPQQFSMHARIKSFRFAFEGISRFFVKEHNSWIHFAATLAVFILAWSTGVTKTELIALVIVIALVWMAEMFNTCIEHIMDFISTKTDPDIKFIKDLASGAVLVAAIAAVLTGLIIFIPKFF